MQQSGPPGDETLDCVGFTLIIDDIVTHDGTTYMQQLGGGGAQALFGYQLVTQCLDRPAAQLGLAAGVGQEDLPEQCRTWLTALQVDVSGLIEGPLPTPRAWQLFEQDGTRTQVWRVPESDALYRQLRPSFDQLPGHLQRSRHYHLGIHAAHPPMKLLAALSRAAHANGGLLSVETYTCCDAPPPAAQLAQLLSTVDVFSPNLAEAASILGPGRSPQELLQELLDRGSSTVVLRMGEEGVLVGQRVPVTEGASGALICHVPAVPDTRVVDVTGCGNACCGGFLAALDAGLAVQDSAAWGCVAGSIMAEAQGVPAADVQLLLPTARAKHALLQAHRASQPGQPGRQHQQVRAEMHTARSTVVTHAASGVQCSSWDRRVDIPVRRPPSCHLMYQQWRLQPSGGAGLASSCHRLRLSV